MKKTRMEKGITLIALIITIVVLLILASVAISSIQENGILSYAQNAKNKWEQAISNEQALLNSYMDFLNQNEIFADIPNYHQEEAARVINTLLNFKREHPNSLIFGAISDNHVTDAEKDKTSAKHAAFALDTVGSAACDFIVNLGDNIGEANLESESAIKHAQYMLNLTKSGFSKIPSYRIVGNHDKSNNTEDVYNLNGIFNDFDNYGTNRIRGFGYKDWEDKKVRIICLNTTDYLGAMGGNGMSYDQKDFLMRALDLSNKSDSSEWQILLLSHIPLDYTGGDYNKYNDLQTILTAYENGTTATIQVNNSYALNETPSNYETYSNGNLVYSYSGKNSAKIIANIHGHVHNNVYGKITNTDIVRIATANSHSGNKAESYPENGDYSISSAEAAKIKKVANSVKDTSATFYAIDLDEEIIYSFGYGADIDRTVVYKDATIYSVNYALTLCSSSNTTSEIVEGASYTTTITPIDSDGTIKTVKVTMGGIDITSSAYSNGKITIAEVTGNISITGVVEVPLISETITPHIAPRSTWYNGLGGGTLNLNNSNMECALGVSIANDYAFTDRNGKTFYLMPIDSKYCKATLNYSATDGIGVQYYLQAIKDNDGTLSSVATVGKGTTNVISWAKGTADYLLISIEHTDGITKWDWSSTGKTVTVTFSNQ